MYANFLDFLAEQLRRNGNSDRTVRFPEGFGGGNGKRSILDPDAGDNQREESIFREVMRYANLIELISATLSLFNQSEEGFERTVNDFESLLCNVGIEKCVVLASLAGMVVPFIAEIFPFKKEILPDAVKPFIVEVFRQPAHCPESCVLRYR